MEQLSEKALEMKRAYQREWRAKNREKVSQYNKEYREKYKDRKKEATIRYWNKKAAEQETEQGWRMN